MSVQPHLLRLALCLAAMHAPYALAAGNEIARAGDLEMRCVAMPTTELTPETARGYNVAREPQRGLLTVTLLRHVGQGKTQTQHGQVFAGAVNSRNFLSNIPVREVRQGDVVTYVGEFHVTPPDTLRFLVNASVGGTPMKVDFARNFGAP
jgi:hypothetical protein